MCSVLDHVMLFQVSCIFLSSVNSHTASTYSVHPGMKLPLLDHPVHTSLLFVSSLLFYFTATTSTLPQHTGLHDVQVQKASLASTVTKFQVDILLKQSKHR